MWVWGPELVEPFEAGVWSPGKQIYAPGAILSWRGSCQDIVNFLIQKIVHLVSSFSGVRVSL